MKHSLIKLINEFASESQRKEIEYTQKHTEDKYIVNYMSLLCLLDTEKIVSNKEVADMFDIDNIDVLTTVDFIIARIIKALSVETGKDIARGYENALVLDNTQPELDYLIEESRKYLITKNQHEV